MTQPVPTSSDLLSGPAPDPSAFEAIPGFLAPEEGQALYRAAKLWPGLGPVVEVGSFKGRSTCWLAQGVKDRGQGIVLAVDHFQGSAEHQNLDEVKSGQLLSNFALNLASAGLLPYINILPMHSGRAATIYAQRPARLIFIDASHDEGSVSDDYYAWEDHLLPFAGVAFHDVGPWDGPTRLYDKLTREYRLREIASVGTLRIAARTL